MRLPDPLGPDAAAPDPLPDLVAELRAMSPRARDAILLALTAEEQARLAPHLVGPNAAASGLISPWLAERARQFRGDLAEDAAARVVTPAARAALLECLAATAPSAPPIGRSPQSPTGALAGSLHRDVARGDLLPRRSLFDTMRDAIAPRRVQP